MGQAHSHFEKPGGFWHRNRSKALRREPSPESFIEISPPPPEADHSSAQIEQSSTKTITTPASVAPNPEIHGATMADTKGKVGKAGNVDKDEECASSPRDQATDDRSDKPGLPTQPAGESTSGRPALKREHTPPHRVRIETTAAWEIERAYGNVHDHVTQELNRIRQQQTESDSTSPAARKTELDVYKAADSCTLALEYLVGNFSTKFFHYAGPESIMGMMATIEADATALDDLRWKQRQMSNYGHNLERKIAQTEAHIRELAELAKRIRDGDGHGQAKGEANAGRDADPKMEGEKDTAGGNTD